MSNPVLHQGLAGQVVKRLQRRGGPAMGLRMTAMIDVIFLLLTFFVLTARIPSPERKLPVIMPKPAAQAASLQQKGAMQVKLSVAESGCQVTVAQSEPVVLSPSRLEVGIAAISSGVLDAAKAYDIAGQGVEIYCDDAVQWDYVVKVYDILYRMGATKITFVTKQKTSS